MSERPRLRVVDLFCGCGGWAMGLHRAANELGIEVEVVAAYDSWPKAVEIYNRNLPQPVAVVRDLKTMQRSELPPHDLVIGGPPCQPFSMAGKRQGHSDERNCLPDFVRLAGDSPYVMENVVSRLINAPWSEKLCAADFGDVTSRKRWFYSNYLLHVIPTPGPRRIRDIRDHAEDERVLKKRGLVGDLAISAQSGRKATPFADDEILPSVVRQLHRNYRTEDMANALTEAQAKGCKAGNHGHYDSLDSLDSLSAHSWHGHDIRGSGKLVAIAEVTPDDSMLGSLSQSSHHGPNRAGNGKANMGSLLRLGLRGNSASASAFEDDEILGSVLSNSFHANEASRIVACRNPSLLEMARAHSIPDSFDFCGATKSDRGKLIANSVPCGLAAGVSSAILRALISESTLASASERAI